MADAYYDNGTVTLYQGAAVDVLRGLPAGSAQCCVTSPPYWGLRDYGVPGQLGLEPTPDEFVAKLVEVFREVRRVLRDDGTVWLNLGDTYTGGKLKVGDTKGQRPRKVPPGFTVARGGFSGKTEAMPGRNAFRAIKDTRNKRSVWTVATQPYKGAHFATFPPKLIEPCILAGCPAGGLVLDPFFGSGTTGAVSARLERRAVGIELNPEYCELAKARCAAVPPRLGLFEQGG
jgi:site-specific DNA-methyltransferase (cytosine-N4-specific)